MQNLQLLITALVTSACLAQTHAPKSPSTKPSPLPGHAVENTPDLSPRAWQDLAPAAFENWLDSVPSAPLQPPESLESLASLAAQKGAPEIALRATLILATLDQSLAAGHLLKQLEARQEHPERFTDAADVTAAAALGRSRFALPLDLAPRLAALAAGASAHPDLEVRTECARAALRLGRTEVADFLLRLTRLGTPLGRQRDGNWHSPRTTTWSRDRAAETLAEALAIANPYRGDASLAAREKAALALQEAWMAFIEGADDLIGSTQ